MDEFITISIFIIVIIYSIINNRGILKKLSKLQIIGVGLSYAAAIFLAFVMIYYGGNWLAGHFSNIFIKYVIFTAIVLLALYISVGTLSKVLRRITNGVLPKH